MLLYGNFIIDYKIIFVIIICDKETILNYYLKLNHDKR